jgi:hypothetical protein
MFRTSKCSSSERLLCAVLCTSSCIHKGSLVDVRKFLVLPGCSKYVEDNIIKLKLFVKSVLFVGSYKILLNKFFSSYRTPILLPYLQQPSTYQGLFYKFFYFFVNVELFLLRLYLCEVTIYFKTRLLRTMSFIFVLFLIAFIISLFQVRRLGELMTRKEEFRMKL